ncbi:MAG TPA: PKD domain-containing protein [Methanomicrobiales archaeon]|nr:PKD domain-containing protein [Methanomicrobiales archaeon]
MLPLAAVLFCVLGSPAMALAGYEARITSGPSQHTWPSLSGDLIAFEDDRNGQVDIYLFNLSSGGEQRLTDEPGEHYWPKIYGDRVVWWENRSGVDNFDVFMYNVTTGVETRITSDPANQENADLYRDRIVWMDRRSGNFDVYLYNTTVGSETRITDDPADQWEPQVWGDRIVWMDNRSNPGYDPSAGYFDYYTYDLSTRTEQAVTTQGWAWYGGLSGDRLVWSQWRPDSGYPGGYNEQIYLYDFSTGTETRVTSDASNHWYPKVFGDRIVWEDDRNGADSNWDIFLYNATTGTEDQVTSLPAAQMNPVIWGDRIAYEDYRDGNSQIFLYTLISRPIADFAANASTGPAPLAVQFIDRTAGNVTGWLWDFGDGTTSKDRNPVHTYAQPGSYAVSLTATNEAGSDTATRSDAIIATRGILPLPGFVLPPTDPDADGKYEDLTGDGQLRFNDVVAFFKNMKWIAGNEPIPAFDMNGNGRIDFNDVVKLFQEL